MRQGKSLRIGIRALLVPIVLGATSVTVAQEAVTGNVPGISESTVTQGELKTIKGKVSDDAGETLPGAVVKVKGVAGGVITDVNGIFDIKAKKGDELEITMLGYQPLNVTVTDKDEYDLKLKIKNDELDEVTVVAFAKQKKESVISSISTVSPSELKVPASNLTTALAGRLAGLISYQTSGEPGKDNAQFFVRGVTTFGYKTDPLILIDNVELSADDLARLSVDDIASFSIMKDATATALYGARGANGVILVTTKEGREGRAKVSFRFENSMAGPVHMVELADPITYMRLNNEAVRTRHPLGVLPYSEAKIANTANGGNPYVYPAVNWYDELFKKHSMNQRAYLSVSGGGNVARYYIAASISCDNGLLKVNGNNNFNNNIDLKKYSIRSNTNINLTSSTEAIVRVQGNFDDYSGPIDGGDGLFAKAMKASPTLFPKYYPSPNPYASHIYFGNYGSGNYINPYADMVKGYKTYNRILFQAQGELRQKLDFVTPGLNVRGLASISSYVYSDISRAYGPYYYMSGSYNPNDDTYALIPLNENSGYENVEAGAPFKDIQTTTYVELATDYNNTFGDNNVSGMLVFTLRNQQNSNYENLQLSLPHRNMGLSGRFTYSYDSRYFAEFNFGYNGSERFHKKERFGFFPSFGLGYVISNESFWEPISLIVNNLKLKATYGLVGNDAIGSDYDRFYYLSNVNMNDGGLAQDFGYNFGNHLNGISISRYGNNLITWEKAKKLNLGIELTLFSGLQIQADVFHEYRSNILMDRAYVPTTMGLMAAIKANVGEASGHGVDISLDYSKSFTKDIWLQARANFTYADSKFEKVEEPNYALEGTPWRSKVGQNLSQRWGYIAERLFVDDEEVRNSPRQEFGSEVMAGDIKYKDINGDGKIDSQDQVPIGYPQTPKITYGFGVSTGYKNVDLSLFFQGNALSSFWIDPVAITPFVDTDNENTLSQNALLAKIADSHWSEDNRDLYAFWPRLGDAVQSNNTQSSTWWMRDGSFMRLKSVEIGYSLPQNLIKKVGLSTLRIYLSGTNLLTFSKFKLWDPEMGANGLGYPIQRVYNVGVNLNF